ncbi:hypothetical protein V8F20_005729 [Naviculisporaceae sp. PSN 640]
MSLGVRQLWGFWRRASLAPRVSSLIPRGPLFLPHTSPAFRAAFFSSRPRSRTETTSASSLQDSRPGRSRTSEDRAALFIERLSKLPIRAHETHLPVMVNIYPHRGERARELRKLRHHLYQQRHHTERLRQRYGEKATPRDWRRILKTLLDATPIYSANIGAVKIPIPESLIHGLSTDPVNNIWEIKSRSGCEIQVHERDPDDPEDNTYLLLSGEWNAIDRAVRHIGAFGPPRVVPLAEEEAQRLQAHVSPIPWKRDSPIRRKYFLNQPLSEIKKPETWTFDTFERYITALTKSRVPSGRHHELSHGVDHGRNVARLLLKAFRDPAALPALTLTSFKHALRFLAEQGDGLWDYRKRLFHMMISHGFEIGTDTYDIMSLAAIKVNDLGFFRNYVNYMVKNGLCPSLTTWIHFLRMIKVEEIRRYILHAMASKRLFEHPSAMHLVSGELIEHDIYRAIQSGFNVKSFIASQNDLYGSQWLHWQTSNKVLDILGSHGKFDEINEFLTVMFQSKRARPKDEIALNIILTHCKTQQKLDQAIYFVERFEAESKVLRTSGITYHLLSTLAWRLKKPHMFSVLWRYSYLEMLTPRYMTIRFRELLLSPRAASSIHRFTKSLRIAGVYPRPPDGKPDDSSRSTRGQSSRILRLSMQNLLLCDYKRELGIKEDRLLTGEELNDAINVWYPRVFRQRRPVDRLGDRLLWALKEDRRIGRDSKAGKEIVLEPLPIRTRNRSWKGTTHGESELERHKADI